MVRVSAKITALFLLAAFTFAVQIVGAHGQALNLTAGRCLTDDEVSADERAPYEEAATRFVETVIGDKPDDAYFELADELRAKVSTSDFARAVNQVVRPFRPFSALHVEHSYRESQVTLGNGRSNVPCTAVAHGSMSAPEDRVMIAAMPVPLQAHVIVEGKAKNNRFAFVLWLFPHSPSWRIGGFYILPITILDRTATDIWKLARQEQ